MTTFALVHGAAHGGWCWEQVIPELEARGHACVAPDLPVEDESAGAGAYARVVVDALTDVEDEVIVVGHSLGGLTIPLVAQQRPVRRLVFLGALVPMPGMSAVEYLATQPDAVAFTPAGSDGVEDPGGTDTGGPSGGLSGDPVTWAEPDADVAISWADARANFFHDVPEETARRAWSRLRPQSMTPLVEPCPLTVWPDVPVTSIVMTDDRTTGPAWSRRVATERLGADLIELGGSHSPFYSRPVELAEVLSGLA